MRFGPPLTVLAIVLAAATASGQDIVFRHVFDQSALDVSGKPGETLSPEVLEFHKTGQNPFKDKPDAIAHGRKIYLEMCASCHMPDGSGGMGASLIEDYHVYDQVKTDAGLFAVIFGGGAGAMQPFSKRMSQDDILKVMAYVRTLMKP
jgi:cytochrome c-L